MLKASQFKDMAQVFSLCSRTSVLTPQSPVVVRTITRAIMVVVDVASELRVVKMTIGKERLELIVFIRSQTNSYVYSY